MVDRFGLEPNSAILQGSHAYPERGPLCWLRRSDSNGRFPAYEAGDIPGFSTAQKTKAATSTRREAAARSPMQRDEARKGNEMPNGMPRPSRQHRAVDWAMKRQEAPLRHRRKPGDCRVDPLVDGKERPARAVAGAGLLRKISCLAEEITKMDARASQRASWVASALASG